MWLVVGLGNPGPEYAGTRHNVGFRVADLLAARWRAGRPTRRFGAELVATSVADAAGADRPLVLVKPLEYMNVSGQAVRRVMDQHRVALDRIVVVHDDIDLDFGRVKVKLGGGHGGHNGLRSLIACLGGPDFVRVRIGVGRPTTPDAADYVLADFSRAERAELAELLERAADAAETVVREGATAAMNRYNVREDGTPERG